jgi:hypothetical protein
MQLRIRASIPRAVEMEIPPPSPPVNERAVLLRTVQFTMSTVCNVSSLKPV